MRKQKNTTPHLDSCCVGVVIHTFERSEPPQGPTAATQQLRVPGRRPSDVHHFGRLPGIVQLRTCGHCTKL